ncbi:creatininase family protein [Aeoliella sp.]|uniref:creatininase family protein n=1 Tax=Aeoliella sp. TaxID=2795800 RepID=UPI003CCBFCFE
MPIRSHLLLETNYRQLRENPPNVAVLPWGATEAHNYHLPYGTDVIEAARIAEHAAALANNQGAQTIVLPTIPYGNDSQQLDQVATISISTTTALAILRDVCHSLTTQGIDRLVIVNGHGGNQFQPLVRDLMAELPLLIVVVNFYELAPDAHQAVFEAPGDHADEMETSLLLHLEPELVEIEHAGSGARRPFDIAALRQPGVWTPRPWSHCHADTGSGDPSRATAEKGRQYFEAVTQALANVIEGLSKAKKGDLPYLE